MLYLSEADVKAATADDTKPSAVCAGVRSIGGGQRMNQPRRRLILDTGSALHSMAGPSATISGLNSIPPTRATARTSTFMLYDAETAEPLA